LDARISEIGARPGGDLDGVLNSNSMSELRTAIRDGRRAECKTCVCSMWRDLDVVCASAHSRVYASA
jgi:hypothetical protein